MLNQLQVQSSTIPNLIIKIIKAACEKYHNARLHIGMLLSALSSTKLRQCGNRSCTDYGILQDNAIVNISDVFRRLTGLWAFDPQQVKNTDSKLSKFTVLDKFTKMRQSYKYVSSQRVMELLPPTFFPAIRHKLD